MVIPIHGCLIKFNLVNCGLQSAKNETGLKPYISILQFGNFISNMFTKQQYIVNQKTAVANSNVSLKFRHSCLHWTDVASGFCCTSCSTADGWSRQLVAAKCWSAEHWKKT